MGIKEAAAAIVILENGLREFGSLEGRAEQHYQQLKGAKKPDQAAIDAALESLRDIRARKQEIASAHGLAIAHLRKQNEDAVRGKGRVVSEGKRGAMVVIVVNGKSYTRHLKRVNGEWRGWPIEVGASAGVDVAYDLRLLDKASATVEAILDNEPLLSKNAA